MKVFIIRHGESESNKAGLWTGWLDAPLTEKGRADAKAAAGLLSGVCFDKVYTSDLSRACETARIALPDHEYVKSALLREINVGSIAGKPLSVLSPEEKRRVAEEGYGCFAGESRGEMRARVVAFMQGLEKEEGENIAIFSHAGFLRYFMDIVVGITLPRGAILCKNCTVAVFEYDGGWKLHSWINLS